MHVHHDPALRHTQNNQDVLTTKESVIHRSFYHCFLLQLTYDGNNY